MSRLENREKFMELMRKTERAGVEDMLKWLDTTDFYSAPASTRYHGSYPGGLVQHTLNVAYELKQLVDFYDMKIPKDSILICALGHDFCKINTYRETIVNVPPQRTKSGKWEQQQGYKKDEYLKLDMEQNHYQHSKILSLLKIMRKRQYIGIWEHLI